MTAPCQACGEDPDLGAMCPVAELRHVPSRAPARLPSEPSPEEMANALQDAGEFVGLASPWIGAVLGVTAERSRQSAMETAGRASMLTLIGQKKCVTHGRRGTPSPEEMAKGAGYYAEGAPADAPMLLVRRDLFIAGILAERSRSAAETAALREENARLRAALHEAEQTRDGALYRARLLSEIMLREKR